MVGIEPGTFCMVSKRVLGILFLAYQRKEEKNSKADFLTETQTNCITREEKNELILNK
jgi:hypothetical protein